MNVSAFTKCGGRKRIIANSMNTGRLFRYENKLLILLSLIFGFVLFDRMALSFLVPFFDKELGLNNTQIGLLTSLLALGWAISGYLTGALSDKTGIARDSSE